MKTALITGSTEGIGYEFSKIFAQNGVNLILVARNESRLKQIQEELSMYGVSVDYYAKDLSVLANAEFIFNDLQAKQRICDFVLNNAGFGTNGEYVNLPWEQELSMFELNMITLAYFTQKFAAIMKTQARGKILNVASTASFQPVPYMAGYAATKAFVLNLSQAVNYELRGTGVSVVALCPGVTQSKFHERAHTERTLWKSKFLAHATAREVAQYGYDLLMGNKSVGIHKFMNRALVFMNRFSSRKVAMKLAARTTV